MPFRISGTQYYTTNAFTKRYMNTMSNSTVSKETYYSVKRDQLQCQKRPTKRYMNTMSNSILNTTLAILQ